MLTIYLADNQLLFVVGSFYLQLIKLSFIFVYMYMTYVSESLIG